MRNSQRPLVIVSRRSHLAQVQARLVGESLLARDPRLVIEHRFIDSQGDLRPEASLAAEGGKGLFVRAVEQALLDGSADLAVHSAKDLPSEMTRGLTMAATPRRADVRDCLISREGYSQVADLPQGAKVGTSGPRRISQLLALRGDLRIVPLRGNLDTRLAKVLEQNVCDATLLATAGLHRAGLGQHATHTLEPEVLLPAAGQGALALQCRADDHVTLLRCLPANHADTATAVACERRIVASLNGDCHSAIAVYCQPVPAPADEGGTMRRADVGRLHYRLRVKVLSPDGRRIIEVDETVAARHLGRLVKQTIASLRKQNASRLLRA